MAEQTFIQANSESWLNMAQFPGTQFLPLAEDFVITRNKP